MLPPSLSSDQDGGGSRIRLEIENFICNGGKHAEYRS
jgi:hypothetical protein